MRDSIYLDYAATTPVDPRVVDAMAPFWTEIYGNSASIHSYGRAASKGIEQARAKVADVLHCHPTEIIFTAGGTESDNLALRGAAWAARSAGRGNHIVTTAIEHHAVLSTVAQLRDLFGFDVTILPVDVRGQVYPEQVEQAIREDTVLVSVMYANNEVGTIQPLKEIGQITQSHDILLHTDAVQAGGKLKLNVAELGVDLLSLSAHKFYGPKGVGTLYARRDVLLESALTGGEQERGKRGGTVNIAGSVGLATALSLAEGEREQENRRLAALRDLLIDELLKRVPDARLTGHPTERLADNASFAFYECDGEALLLGLDLAGIAASTGSACSTGDPEPSHVLTAMGIERRWSVGSLRLTLGRTTTATDIEKVLDILPGIVERTRTLNVSTEV